MNKYFYKINLTKIIAALLIGMWSSAQTIAQSHIWDVIEVEKGCDIPKRVVSEDGPSRSTARGMAPPPPPYNTKEEEPPLVIDVRSYQKELGSFLARFEKDECIKIICENELYLNEENLWGLRSKNGKILLEPQFESASLTSDKNYFKARKEGAYSYNIYDQNGKAMLPQEYGRVTKIKKEDFFRVSDGLDNNLVNLAGELVYPQSLTGAWRLGDYIIFCKGKSQGLADTTGHIILEPQFLKIKPIVSDDGLSYFAANENGYLTLIKNGKIWKKLGVKFHEWGAGILTEERYLFYQKKLIDLKKGKFIMCSDAKLEITSNKSFLGLYEVKQNRNTFVIDTKGKLDKRFEGRNFSRLHFSNGLALMVKDLGTKEASGKAVKRYGLIDKGFKWMLAPEYLYIYNFNYTNLYAVVNENNKFAVLNEQLEVIVPFEYVSTIVVSDKIIAIKSKETKEADVFDIKGEKLFTTTFSHDKPRNLRYGIMEAYRFDDNKRVLLGEELQEIYGDGVSNWNSFGDEAIWIEYFSKVNQYTIIDKKGKPYPILINGEERTDYLGVKKIHHSSFFNILLADNHRYIYNVLSEKAYKVHSEVDYIEGDYFKGMGILKTRAKGQETNGIIDTLGNEILPPVFNGINFIKDYRIFILSNVDRNYAFDRFGVELFTRYDNVFYLQENFFALVKNGKYGVLNLQGEVIIPFNYKSIYNRRPGEINVKSFDGKNTILSLDGSALEY